MKITQKLRKTLKNTQNILLKKNIIQFFLKILFDENVAQDLAQLLARTLYPYLFWVLRNLPHNFEKVADGGRMQSAKKTLDHMGTSQSSSPQKTTTHIRI